MKLLVGLTGSLGSGKTTVAKFFKKLGAQVIDADSIGHQVLMDKKVKEKIILSFGRGILKNGRIDRGRLAGLAFKSGYRLNKLCNIVHPPILKKIRQISKSITKGIVVIDAPVLIESGFYEEMDKVILIVADKKNQFARCSKSYKSKKEVLKRLKHQAPLIKKIRYADFVIDNNGSRFETKRQVLEVWRKLNKVPRC